MKYLSLLYVRFRRGFLFVGLHCYEKNFKVWRSENKIKIKIELEPKTYKITVISGNIAFVDDISSDKEVNFSVKISLNIQILQLKSFWRKVLCVKNV